MERAHGESASGRPGAESRRSRNARPFTSALCAAGCWRRDGGGPRRERSGGAITWWPPATPFWSAESAPTLPAYYLLGGGRGDEPSDAVYAAEAGAVPTHSMHSTHSVHSVNSRKRSNPDYGVSPRPKVKRPRLRRLFVRGGSGDCVPDELLWSSREMAESLSIRNERAPEVMAAKKPQRVRPQ